jgi:hypothetical protein
MPQTIDTIATLEQLTEQLHALERRIAALESRDEKSRDLPLPAAPIQRPRPPATWRGFPPVETPAGAITIIGKAVLGLAGAYLLRALAESNAIPKLPVLVVAILYACFWMLWAVRTTAKSRFTSVTYSLTSALILSPMLWETTVSFHVLSPTLASVVLVGFVVLTIALAWKRDLQLIPWVATLSSVITAIALIIATQELVPLTAALLAIALTTEIAACLGHRLTLRLIPAIAADFSVWLLVYILTAETLTEGYHPASPATLAILSLSLLAIYGAAIAFRTFIKRDHITILEIAQGIAAFILATFGTLRATHNYASPALGGFFLILSAACYWGALFRFTDDVHTRNRRVFATWAAALLLAGSFLALPASASLIFLSLSSVAATALYARTAKLSLGLHASFNLIAAGAISPLPLYAANALAGTVPSAPDWQISLVALSALACYVAGSRHPEAEIKRRLLWIVPGAVISFTIAALAIAAIVELIAPHLTLDASRLSVIRTVVNCALALALAFLCLRLHRVELGWLAYASVAFGTLKLLFEDLRFGNAASLVVSLLFYGLVLILLPKLTRRQPPA